MTGAARELLARAVKELGLTVPAEDLAKFDLYAAELKKWNSKINLTAITKDEDVALKHFADSLTLVNRLEPHCTLVDVGSGAGFPGIPLKIVRPDLQIVSIDAVEKKILFQRHVARVLGLQKFEAVHGRVEGLQKSYAGHFDVAVSRAFSDLSSFVAMAFPLIKDSGRVVAMKGKEGAGEATHAGELIKEQGGMISQVDEFALPVVGDRRCLIIIQKSLPA